MEYVVKKYKIAYADLALSFLIALVACWLFIPASATQTGLFLVAGFFVGLSIVHELSHLSVAKLFNQRATIRFFPKLGALMLDYVSLPFAGYIRTALAPLATVQVPLLVMYLATQNQYLLLLNVLHLVASSVDITGLLFTLVKHGTRCTLHLVYDSNCKVTGVVIEEKDKATYYAF